MFLTKIRCHTGVKTMSAKEKLPCFELFSKSEERISYSLSFKIIHFYE